MLYSGNNNGLAIKFLLNEHVVKVTKISKTIRPSISKLKYKSIFLSYHSWTSFYHPFITHLGNIIILFILSNGGNRFNVITAILKHSYCFFFAVEKRLAVTEKYILNIRMSLSIADHVFSVDT